MLDLKTIKNYDDSWYLEFIKRNTVLDTDTLKIHKEWLIARAEQAEKYEKIIHAIANIDTLFINGDGSEREWDYREAMEAIERLVMPVWEEHCKNKRGE